MKEQAAAALGEPVIETAVVSPKGQGRRMMTAGVARELGGVLGAGAAGAAMKARSDTPGGV